MDKRPEYLLRHTIAGAKPQAKGDVFRFGDVQSAWLGFMALNKNLGGNDDAVGDRGRYGAGRVALSPDLIAVHHRILGILDGHFRQRRLLIDHLRVLRFYGLKGRPPRLWVTNEARAHTLWQEALGIILPAFIAAGYVEDAFKRRWRDEMAAVMDEVCLMGEAGLRDGEASRCGAEGSRHDDGQARRRRQMQGLACCDARHEVCSRAVCRVRDGGFHQDGAR